MIHKKLLDFQKLGITIKKGERNPHFKNNYANLNEVLDKVTKPLNEMGIVIIQTPTTEGLETTLYDTEDNTHIKGFLPFMGTTNPQHIGSNLTYYRRYSLVTMLGLEDEDDDGNKASIKSSKENAKKIPVADEDEDLDLDLG
jgi:hypothetical protein